MGPLRRMDSESVRSQGRWRDTTLQIRQGPPRKGSKCKTKLHTLQSPRTLYSECKQKSHGGHDLKKRGRKQDLGVSLAVMKTG